MKKITFTSTRPVGFAAGEKVMHTLRVIHSRSGEITGMTLRLNIPLVAGFYVLISPHYQVVTPQLNGLPCSLYPGVVQHLLLYIAAAIPYMEALLR